MLALIDRRLGRLIAVGAFLVGVQTSAVAQAGTRFSRFRSGTVLAAELTEYEVPIVKVFPHDPLPVATGGGTLLNAIVYVKFDPGRGFGIHDYVLADGLREFRCVAFAEGDAVFDATHWSRSATNPNSIYRLYFIVEVSAGAAAPSSYRMRCKISNVGLVEVPIPFKKLGRGEPSRVRNIPASGALEVTGAAPARTAAAAAPEAPAAAATPPASAASTLNTTGTVDREWWTGISGIRINNLTGHKKFPDSPSGADTLSSLQAVSWEDAGKNQNWADNYGQRIRGYLVPPVSGEYSFWISSDDASELWISPDHDPAKKDQIAIVPSNTRHLEWNKFPVQRSIDPLKLQAGRAYYIEILHKEGDRDDHLAVGWLKPGEKGREPSEVVPGSALSSFKAGVPK